MSGEEDSRIFKLLETVLGDSSSILPDKKYSTKLVDTCLELFTRDNVCTTLDNHNSYLCSTYPVKLIIPLQQKSSDGCDESAEDSSTAGNDLKNFVIRGKFARTRGRFPVPSLLIGNKYVCRSSTLARSAEIYTRQGYQYFVQGESSAQAEAEKPRESDIDSPFRPVAESAVTFKNDSQKPKLSLPPRKQMKLSQKLVNMSMQRSSDSELNTDELVHKMRKADMDLLRILKVNIICDMMVENKKVKYGVNVTSSEKADRLNRYSDFQLVSIPYPGCEFFADYSRNNYSSTGLLFNWNQAFIDAELQVPESISNIPQLEWNRYVEWDIVELTQKYMKLLLNCLVSPHSSGVLLHCISGWDRTPLFVSLLRLSLWADGLIHQSLDAEEIVYLTLAYDWLLFSHQFSDRIYRNEEIMHFCFNFLKHIVSEDYSLLPLIKDDQDLFNYSGKKTSMCDSNGVSNGEEAFDHGRACDSLSSQSQTEDASNDERKELLLNVRDIKKLVSADYSETSSDRLDQFADADTVDEPLCAVNQLSCEQNLNATPATNEVDRCSSNHASSTSDDSVADFPATFSPPSSSAPKSANAFASSSVDLNAARADADACFILKMRLEKRKEKLKIAESEMIPVYCAVVHKAKYSESASGLSAIMGGLESLVKYVRR